MIESFSRGPLRSLEELAKECLLGFLTAMLIKALLKTSDGVNQLPSRALSSFFFFGGGRVHLKATNQKRMPFFSHCHRASEFLFPLHVYSCWLSLSSKCLYRRGFGQMHSFCGQVSLQLGNLSRHMMPRRKVEENLSHVAFKAASDTCAPFARHLHAPRQRVPATRALRSRRNLCDVWSRVLHT